MSQSTENKRKEQMVTGLLELGIYKRSDGKQLYELSIEELEEEIKKVVELVRNHYELTP